MCAWRAGPLALFLHPIHPFLLSTPAPSKQAWLDPVHLPPPASLTCAATGTPLDFLLQVYAPVDGVVAAFHRALFIFVSPSVRDRGEGRGVTGWGGGCDRDQAAGLPPQARSLTERSRAGDGLSSLHLSLSHALPPLSQTPPPPLSLFPGPPPPPPGRRAGLPVPAAP